MQTTWHEEDSFVRYHHAEPQEDMPSHIHKER